MIAAITSAFAADLTAVVVELPTDDGVVECALYARSEDWLSEVSALKRVKVRPRGGQARCDFGALPAGQYAVAVHQDTDEDGEMDYVAGLPQEPWGVSRDAPVRVGRPRWVDAVFSFPGTLVTIKARRLW